MQIRFNVSNMLTDKFNLNLQKNTQKSINKYPCYVIFEYSILETNINFVNPFGKYNYYK